MSFFAWWDEITRRGLAAASLTRHAVERIVRSGRGYILGIPIAGAVGAAWLWIAWCYPLPDARVNLPMVRLYADGEEIATFQGTSRRSQVWVPLAEIPRHVVDAVLAAEDRRFFQHGGIDLRAVARAVIADVRHGEVRQGGSTITQQVARTLFLDTKRTWGRKLHESVIALLIEFRYTKPRILEAYLNSVYLGNSGDVAIRGVGAAARHFLAKDITTVRLDEAALLAAAISAPNRTLGGNPARARAARDTVLRAMAKQAMVTATDLRAAVAQPIRLSIAASTLRAPYFVDLARDEIARRVTLPPQGDVRIHTGLDPFLQRVAERAIADGTRGIAPGRPQLARERPQAALVAIEPASGRIRALVGGRRYLESPFNRATRAARQPGSLFKPIVYLAAFEAGRTGDSQGLTPASLIPDEPLAIPQGATSWSPHNLDGTFHGPVTVRRALEQSLNVPAVRIAQDVGVSRVVQVARDLGIERSLAETPSLALGTSEVTLLEITAAFATLANQGVRVTPTTLAAVQEAGAAGAGIAPSPPPVRAVSAESSFLITHILRGVMREGTGRASARWGLSDVTAGKSGTTDGLRDAWFVGYTPDLVVGVWVGMDDGSRLGLSGARAALPIWARVMQAAVQRNPPREFTPPPGIVFASVDGQTGRPTSFWCGDGSGIREAFQAGTEPPAGCGDGSFFFGWILSLFR
jgi:penicillin-binding protein 1B